MCEGNWYSVLCGSDSLKWFSFFFMPQLTLFLSFFFVTLVLLEHKNSTWMGQTWMCILKLWKLIWIRILVFGRGLNINPLWRVLCVMLNATHWAFIMNLIRYSWSKHIFRISNCHSVPNRRHFFYNVAYSVWSWLCEWVWIIFVYPCRTSRCQVQTGE